MPKIARCQVLFLHLNLSEGSPRMVGEIKNTLVLKMEQFTDIKIRTTFL
jgi:hypothetical protein